MAITGGRVMAGYSEMTDAVLAMRLELAEQVRGELSKAGLPMGSDTAGGLGGVVVEVDAGDDTAGGVFVRWEPSADLGEQAADAVSAGRFDHPSVARSAAVSEAMREAMIAIPRSAGVEAVEAADELRPFTIQIPASE
jgi:hypothetical protein